MSRVPGALPAWWPRPSLLSPLSVLLLVAGTCAAFLLSQLPPAPPLLAAAATSALLAWRVPATRLLTLPLLAASWMLLHAHGGMQARLPATLEGEDLALTLRIVGLPERGERQQRFEARVVDPPAQAPGLAGARLRLSWFDAGAADLLPGEVWRGVVRLKRPRGSLNPGGFDYERFALESGIAATGYLRDAPPPERIEGAGGIDALRWQISAALADGFDAPAVRFLQGLAVGDRRGLQDADWERLRATGLSHLLAISGLHIGLLAALGALLARGVYWMIPTLGLRLPRPQGMALAALPFAFGYAALAGFGLPAQRSLLMIACVLGAVLCRRALLPAQGLALAAFAVLLVSPLALLGASFWLSFLGVAWLLLCLPAQPTRGGFAGALLLAQGVLSVGLLPLTVWFFGQASLAGAVANLLAVPLVSLIIVPLTLLGTALLPWTPLASPFIVSAAWLMEALWRVAGWLESWPWAQVFLPEPSVPALLLALVGIGWLLLPRGLPAKPLAALLLLPLLFPAAEQLQDGELALTVVDVGQGLSVLVRTRQHALLYDAGSAFSGGLDLGEAAVLPVLRARGVAALDVLLISHGDNDHAGGAGAVRRAMAPALRLSGEPVRLGDGLHCADQPAWQWDGVRFSVLHPPPDFPELGNESSCVLTVEGEGGRVLLPGDIGHIIERRLLGEQAQRLAAAVLLVPHHGSSGSSSAEFVAAVAPRHALFATGHRNRFGHPRADVLARYTAIGSAIDGTVDAGAIDLRLRRDGSTEIRRRRDSHRRFWHEASSVPLQPEPAR